MPALVLVLLCAACTSAGSTTPQRRSPIPAVRTPTARRDSVTAVWTPDLNWRHAHPVTTLGSAAPARRLRRDIDAAPRFPPGVFHCPIDVGVRVHLTIRTGASVEAALVTLTGCPMLRVPHRPSRTLTAATVRDLRGLAPARWRRYLDRWRW